MKSLFYILPLFVVITGCSTPYITEKLVIIRDTTYRVLPPVIIDSGKATSITDTVVQIINLNNNDTITHIKYYPREQKFNWKIQPDTVRIAVRDTIFNSTDKYQIIETPLMSKVGIGAFGALIGVIFIIAGYFIVRRLK